MKPGFAPPLALDVNVDKKYLMTLSIEQLISNLRTAFRMADFDSVEKVLEEQQSMLKAEIKELREKLELETLVRMGIEEECKERLGRYERLSKSVKKNTELDNENTIAELRMKNAELADEKRRAESEAESWKRQFEELSERLLMAVKGVNSSMNVDTHVGIGGKVDELPSIQWNTDAGLSDEVMGGKDMDVVDICDNEQGNTTAGSSPSQRKDLKLGNSLVRATEVTRQSLDSPNNALLVASDAAIENAIDILDHECGNTATGIAPSQTKIDDCGNAHVTIDDGTRQSLDTPKTVVLCASEATTGEAIDIHDHEFGDTAADISPSEGKTEDCENTCDVVDDDARQSPDTPNTAVLGASDMANASSGSQKVVIEIEDSDDDDECITTGALNGNGANHDIAAAVDSIGHSSVLGILESLKRKWLPEAGNSFVGLNNNMVDGSDSDNDSSSSSSSLESGVNMVKLPSNFLRSIGDKRRKI